MSLANRPFIIATRGSALALVQAHTVQAQLQKSFPQSRFELRVIKTTGDKLQTVSLVNPDQQVTKGLFTKELEVALLNRQADLAVHSLKDLPTDLPEGLALSAVSERADARDVLIYRQALGGESSAGRVFSPGTALGEWPSGAAIATSSTRRMAQLLAIRPDLKIVPIRGNVGTRLRKLRERPELDGLVLAAAGLSRLSYRIDELGILQSPPGESGSGPGKLGAMYLPLEQMLPCVGQAALGIEMRAHDPELAPICAALNHEETFQCVAAERSFLRAMGGGCLSPIAAFAVRQGSEIWLRAVSFREERFQREEARAPLNQAEELGVQLAGRMRV